MKSDIARLDPLIFGTMYNLYLTRRQTNLIFMPAVGIIAINPLVLLIDNQKGGNYKNVANIVIAFQIKNVGNLPAKNFKIDTIGKIDNTTLSHKAPKKNAGSNVFPQQALINRANINKDLIKDVVENKKRLRYKIKISYSDWKKYQEYEYLSYYEFIVENKNPLIFSFENSSEHDFSTEL